MLPKTKRKHSGKLGNGPEIAQKNVKYVVKE